MLNTLLDQYKTTIGFEFNGELSLDTIIDICTRHLKTFSYSFLQKNLGVRPTLNEESLIKELLQDKFGTCYQHNIAVFCLLKNLGFEVFLAKGNPSFGRNKVSNTRQTHVSIILTVDNVRYIVDPGSGLSICTPLQVNHYSVDTPYKVDELINGTYRVVELIFNGHDFDEEIMCDIDPTPCKIEDFSESLSYLYSEDHRHSRIFFYSQVTTNGTIRKIANLSYREVDAKGYLLYKEAIPAYSGVIPTLQKYFDIDANILAKIQYGDYRHPELAKIVRGEPQQKPIYASKATRFLVWGANVIEANVVMLRDNAHVLPYGIFPDASRIANSMRR